MEEILLKLICEEYDISEEYLFSILRRGKVTEALGMMTYILVIRYGWEVTRVYNFYVTKGYNKTRPCLYNHLKRGTRNIDYYDYSRVVLERIVSEVDEAKQLNVVGVPEEENLYLTRGRIMTKLLSVKSLGQLSTFEHMLDKQLQVNYLKTL